MQEKLITPQRLIFLGVVALFVVYLILAVVGEGGGGASACDTARERLDRSQARLEIASSAVESFTGSDDELEASSEWRELQAAIDERAAAAHEVDAAC